MKQTIKDPDGKTRYSVHCKFCKATWVERYPDNTYIWDYLGLDHHCERVEAKRRIGWRQDNLAGIWISAKSMQWEPKADGSLTKCGAKCQSAKGPNCDCQCHGENHGIN